MIHHCVSCSRLLLASVTLFFPVVLFLTVLGKTGVSPGEGTGATMSDDEDEEHADSEANLFDGNLDGQDTMGFGPLVPTENERSLMERVRHELKHELKQVKKCSDNNFFST